MYITNILNRIICYKNSKIKDDSEIEIKIRNLLQLNSDLDSQYLDWTPTKYEKELLAQTWSNELNFLYLVGTKVFVYLMEHCPNTKNVFRPIFILGDSFAESDYFREQTLRFAQIVSFLIDSLNQPNEIVQRLHAMGEKHLNYSHRGFKPIFFDLFLETLEFALSGHIPSLTNMDDKQRQDAMEAWRKLGLFTTVHVKRGYVSGLMKDYYQQTANFDDWVKKRPEFHPWNES